MILGGQQAYTGQQTINPNLTVELTGVNGSTSLVAGNTASNLYLYFGNGGAYFNIDANATITNMKLTGFPNGYFEINGGTTTLARSPGYTETIGVGVVIASGATLNDQTYNTLTFTNDNLDIHVDGEMDVFYGSGTSNTLIANGGNLHDYIDVDYGTLFYGGKSGVTDTIAVPILVENIGTFKLSAAAGQTASGRLIVQGGVQQTNNASVYLNGQSASVQLASGATLECDNDYYQASGTLETTDTTKCTLQDGALNTGTVTINGGYLIIAQSITSGYGEFDVKCKTLNFNGQLGVAIAGYQNQNQNPVKPGPSDLLQVVNGNIVLGGNSSLYVRVDQQAQLVKNDYWIIISATLIGNNNVQSNFNTETSNPQTNLGYIYNQPNPGQYEITFPWQG